MKAKRRNELFECTKARLITEIGKLEKQAEEAAVAAHMMELKCERAEQDRNTAQNNLSQHCMKNKQDRERDDELITDLRGALARWHTLAMVQAATMIEAKTSNLLSERVRQLYARCDARKAESD